MNYKEKIMDEIKTYNKETQLKFLTSYKQLKEEGKDNEWIYVALLDKGKSVWEQYGFGLMFDERFRKYLNVKYQNRKNKEALKETSIDALLADIITED